MSKDKIEVNMNVYDIPILVEALEEANKEIERLNNIISKATDFINNNSYESGDSSSMCLINIDKLLEILDKGEE